MSDPQRPLSRDQLASFLPSSQAIRAFEKLMQDVFVLNPDQIAVILAYIDEVRTDSGTAQASSNQALAALQSMAQSLAVIAQAPAPLQSMQNVIAGPQALMVNPQNVAPPVQIGTLGQQQADRVNITGGSVNAQIKNNQTILLESTQTLSDGAAASAGTLLNAPVAGNPTKWVPINDNGTTRYIPAW